MAQEYTSGSATPSKFPALEPLGTLVRAIVTLTQAEYDALPVKSATTLYVITA